MTNTKLLSLSAIILVLSVIVAFTIYLGSARDFAEIFNDSASGLGVLLAGLGGGVAFWTWSEEQIAKSKFNKFKMTYPSSELHKTFELVQDKGRSEIFVHDKHSDEFVWIRNWSTYLELGYPDPKQEGTLTFVTKDDIDQKYKRQVIVAPNT